MQSQSSALTIREGLKVANVHAFTDEDALKKELFHRDARVFLVSLAEALELSQGSYEIRSNNGGEATSGVVTLHAKHLYVELYENTTRRGITMVYRSCESVKDFTGGQNNFGFPERLEGDSDAQSRFLDMCRRLMAEGIVNARRRAVA